MAAARKKEEHRRLKQVALAATAARKEQEERVQIARSERALWVVRAELAGLTEGEFRASVRPLSLRREIARSRARAHAIESATAHNLLALEGQI